MNKWNSFSSTDHFFDPQLKKQVARWTLLLPAMNLCHWHLKTGGCSMCGFNGPQSGKKKYQWLAKFFNGYSLNALYRLGYFSDGMLQPENLTIYNGGNFLNSGNEIACSKEEIPLQFQKMICRSVNRHPTINKLFVESRPEFITERNISLLTGLLGSKTLQVGIGLESSDDWVRNQLLRKGIARSDFERAIDVLKSHQAQSLAYIFLKPMGLSEKEAIEDTVNSIEYCFDAGVDEVALSTAFVQSNTPLCEAFERGEYQVPNLWSVIKVIKRTAHLGPIRIGEFTDDPPPIAAPHGCPDCHEKVMAAIDDYRQTRNISVFDGLDCDCK